MYRSWSFFLGLCLLLLSIWIAWWGLYYQDMYLAASTVRLGTPPISIEATLDQTNTTASIRPFSLR
jgi:hypothetical protein